MTRRALALATLLLAVTGCIRFGHRPAAPRPAPPVAGPALPKDSIPPIVIDSIHERKAGGTPDSAFVAAKPAPRTAEKPAERCLLEIDGDRSQFIKDPISQKYTSYFGGGFIGRCSGQGITITADSAEFYDQNQLYFLLGNVKYREKRVHLDADKLTYFRAEERLLAEGNVVAVMSDSSTMTGPRAEYFRAVRGVRLKPRMVATLRPTLRMIEADSTGKRKGEPVVLVADNINGEGDSLFVAWGKVTIDRSDILARGDSANLDNNRQFSRLMKQPYIESKGKDAFTLRGIVIDMYGRNRAVERVVAMDSGVAVNKDLTLASDTIDLRIQQNKLQRAYAFGPGAASAVTRERTILADSIDVRMPNQQLREMYAVRQAYAESDPDSAKVRSSERDWLRGDTIVARFDTLPPADTTSKPRIRDLLASGTASSYYQVPNSKNIKKPGVNYVKGRQIIVDFKAQEVQTVTVVDSASGIFLEAIPDSVASDSTKAKKARPQRAGRRTQGGTPGRSPSPGTITRRQPNAIRRP